MLVGCSISCAASVMTCCCCCGCCGSCGSCDSCGSCGSCRVEKNSVIFCSFVGNLTRNGHTLHTIIDMQLSHMHTIIDIKLSHRFRSRAGDSDNTIPVAGLRETHPLSPALSPSRGPHSQFVRSFVGNLACCVWLREAGRTRMSRAFAGLVAGKDRAAPCGREGSGKKIVGRNSSGIHQLQTP